MPLNAEFEALLAPIEAEAHDKSVSFNYTNEFDGYNVGHDMLLACHDLRKSVLPLCEYCTDCPVDWLTLIRTTRKTGERFALANRDEDGYGTSVFQGVVKILAERFKQCGGGANVLEARFFAPYDYGTLEDLRDSTPSGGGVRRFDAVLDELKTKAEGFTRHSGRALSVAMGMNLAPRASRQFVKDFEPLLRHGCHGGSPAVAEYASQIVLAVVKAADPLSPRDAEFDRAMETLATTLEETGRPAEAEAVRAVVRKEKT